MRHRIDVYGSGDVVYAPGRPGAPRSVVAIGTGSTVRPLPPRSVVATGTGSTEGLTLVEVLVGALILALILLVAGRSIVQLGASAESGNQDASLHMAMTRLIAQHPPEYTQPRTVSGRVSELSGFDRLPERNRRILQSSTYRAEIGNEAARYRIENPGELVVHFQRLSGAVSRF